MLIFYLDTFVMFPCTKVCFLIALSHHYANLIDKMAVDVYYLFSPFIMSTGNQNLTQQELSLCLKGRLVLHKSVIDPALRSAYMRCSIYSTSLLGINHAL